MLIEIPMHVPLRVIDKPLLRCSERIILVGDLHGDAQSLAKILAAFDSKRDILIFIGDYADRGDEGVEVIERIFHLLRMYPDRVIALKGNHEVYTDDGLPQFTPCHLVAEAERKWGSWDLFFQTVFKPFSTLLNLATIIHGEALFVHGGISDKIQTIDDLQNPSQEILDDVLNSDATLRYEGERVNSIRGIGMRYGPAATEAVCDRLNVKRIFRGHQHDMAKKAPSVLHDEKLITLVTARIYVRDPYVLFLDPRSPSTGSQLLRLESGKLEPFEFENRQQDSLRSRLPVMRRNQLTGSLKESVAVLQNKISKGESRSRKTATTSGLNLPASDVNFRYISYSQGDLTQSRKRLPVFLAYVDDKNLRLLDLYYSERPLGPESIRRIEI